MLSVVVPLSTVGPQDSRFDSFSYLLDTRKYPFLGKKSWVKCDMVQIVSNKRLSGVRYRGKFTQFKIDEADFREVEQRVKRRIGIAE